MRDELWSVRGTTLVGRLKLPILTGTGINFIKKTSHPVRNEMSRGTILFGIQNARLMRYGKLSDTLFHDNGGSIPAPANSDARDSTRSPCGSGGNFAWSCFACASSLWHILPGKTGSELLFSVTAI